MTDSYKHKGMRRRLIQTLQAKGITDERVLDAMNRLPRHLFLDNAFQEWAYQDKAFPIGNEQTISQPYTVAYQTILLEVQKRQSVMEIGTGSGYQAAILAMLGGRVYTLERQEVLHKEATKRLESLGLGQIRTYLRDGYQGLPEFAPFDRILVTAGAPEIPRQLCEQLKIGGILVVPVGHTTQKMYKITRVGKTNFLEEALDNFQFVPFLKGLNRK